MWNMPKTNSCVYRNAFEADMCAGDKLTDDIKCDDFVCFWEERLLVKWNQRKVVIMIKFINKSWLGKCCIFVVDEPAC